MVQGAARRGLGPSERCPVWFWLFIFSKCEAILQASFCDFVKLGYLDLGIFLDDEFSVSVSELNDDLCEESTSTHA